MTSVNKTAYRRIFEKVMNFYKNGSEVKIISQNEEDGGHRSIKIGS